MTAIRVRLTAWIPRGLEDRLGPVTVRVRNDPAEGATGSVDCEVELQGAKRSLSDSRAGAAATLTFMDQGPTTDDALASAAIDLAPRAFNRIVHLAAFAGNNEKVLRLLDDRDLVDVAISISDSGGSIRSVAVPEKFVRSPRVKGSGLTQRVQALVARTNVAEPEIAEALWLDALEAVFDDRPREALVLARACVEVSWEACVRAVLHARASTWPPEAASYMEALLSHALRAGLTDRLDHHSALLLGFSFQKGWPPDAWGRLASAIKARNEAAHGPASADIEEARRAVTIVRAVLDQLASLHP